MKQHRQNTSSVSYRVNVSVIVSPAIHVHVTNTLIATVAQFLCDS